LGTSKETFLGVAIYPLSFVVIALIFSELRRGEEAESPPRPPRSQKTKKKPGLNRVKQGNSTSGFMENFIQKIPLTMHVCVNYEFYPLSPQTP